MPCFQDALSSWPKAGLSGRTVPHSAAHRGREMNDPRAFPEGREETQAVLGAEYPSGTKGSQESAHVLPQGQGLGPRTKDGNHPL